MKSTIQFYPTAILTFLMAPIAAYVEENFLMFAVATRKSGIITNRDAVPSVISSRTLQGANIQHARGVVTTVSGDDIASKYIFCQVPSNALIVSMRLTCADVGTTTIMDIGLYRTTPDGGAVVDADLFASAVVLNAGALAKVEVLRESTTITEAKGEKLLWDLAGLTADPRVMYDVVGTLTAAADAAAAIMIEVDYVV